MDNNTPKTSSGEAGHETADVRPLAVWLTGLGLCVCCVLLMALVLGMINLLQRRHDEADRTEAVQTTVPSVSESVPTFPGPRLQVAPEVDLAAFRAQEDAELNNYGWVDRKAGVIRIPIEHAMDLIAERGLPYRGEPGAPAPTRTVLDMQQARPSDWATQQQPK